MRFVPWRVALALCVVVALSSPSSAAPTDDARRAEAQAAWAAAEKTATVGPADLPLAGEAHLKLPAGEMFFPAAEANRVMHALGNDSSPRRLGMIVPTGQNVPWLIDVGWIKEGYVRDGEAKDWKADTLLASLSENTEAANPDRQARGFPPLDVVGWAEPPAYDGTAHRLVWSLLLREKGAVPDRPQTANYNTYALGREGYFELDLITDARTVGTDKAVVRDLLGHLDYLPGKTYADFNPSTDRIAAYGLGALIGLVAVKKLGLLAMAGLFLLKIWKLGMLAMAGAIAAARRFLGRGKPSADG